VDLGIGWITGTKEPKEKIANANWKAMNKSPG